MMPKEDFPAEMMGTILSQPCTLPFSLASAQSANQELPIPFPSLEVGSKGQSMAGNESCDPSTHQKQQVC